MSNEKITIDDIIARWNYLLTHPIIEPEYTTIEEIKEERNKEIREEARKSHRASDLGIVEEE